MKNRVISISLALALVLSVGLIGCGGEEVPEIPEYNLTISSTDGGSVTQPGEAIFTYDEGTVVNLVAEADEGYHFVNWTGDESTLGNVNAAITIITTNGDYEITANFAIETLQIRDWYDLDAIGTNLGGSYSLMNDLDSTTADPVQDFITAHAPVACPCLDVNAEWDSIAPGAPTAVTVVANTMLLATSTHRAEVVIDNNDPHENSVIVPVTSNPSDLASLPGWYWYSSYGNYAPSGMPDFDQRQDNWKNADTQGWTFCGPTAAANCFWWLDSKYADPAGVPGDGNDTFPLVRDYGGASAAMPGPSWDDHNFSNVNDLATPWPPADWPPTLAFVPGPQPQPSGMPAWGELVERLAWIMDTDGIRTRGGHGTYHSSLLHTIPHWLWEEGLDDVLDATYVEDPDFYFMAEKVERGECVILILGFWWEETPGVWERKGGGHYVTVAGVNSDELLVAFSDPSRDQTPPADYQEHNDAAIVSHDIWCVALDSPRSDGRWWLPDYRITDHAIVEGAIIIFPIPPAVVTWPASAIGTTSVSLSMRYTLGDQSTVDIRFAYRKAGAADWTETPWVSVLEAGTHTDTLAGLGSNTTYEFKAELRYDETVIEGDVRTFTTEKMGPSVTTEDATDITADSVTLNMTFTGGDYSPVEVRFSWREFGNDLWTETSWTSEEEDGTHVDVLSGLDSDTIYLFKAELKYDYPAVTIEGAVLTFTTKEEGRCFIATAAYGTPMAEETQALREFRDEYLLTNHVGQGLVGFYYRVSPPMAEFITEHPSLKPLVRAGLVPAVAMSTVVVNTTLAEKVIIVGSLVLVSVAVAMAIWVIRRRGRGSEHI